MNSLRLPTWSKWAAGGLGLAALILWGGSRAYCHLHGSMARSAAPAERLEEQRLPAVSVVTPIRKAATRTITLPASVDAFEKATLYAKVAGYLQWIKADKGDKVRQGEVLALIEVPEMAKEYQRAQAVVQEAQAASERARADAALKDLTFKRLEGVRDSEPEVISEQEVDVARAAGEVAAGDVRLAKARLDVARAEMERFETLMEYAKIKSPYNGIVSERFVDPGALIQKGTDSGNVAPIVTVMSVDRVRVYVAVSEPDVPFVKRGEPAEVRFDALPGRQFHGRVARFATALDPQTRTMKTEIDFENPGFVIRPGMFGAATLTLAEEPNALALPSESVRQDVEPTKKYVYIVVEGRLKKVPVETGLDDGRMVQVTGLRGGEAVVLAGAERLKEGMTVRPTRADN